jgi:hypothetical protein
MLSPSEIVVSRAGLTQHKTAAEAKPAPEPTPSTMAERFAPEGQKSSTEGAPRAQASPAVMPGLIAEPTRVTAGGRWLLIASLVVSLVPTAVILALIWQGAIRLPEREGAQRPPETERFGESNYASLAALPIIAPQDSVEISVKPEIALTAPVTLPARSGEEVPFDIAIDSSDALPARSVIAIRALPEGARFSQGRPYGENEWNLRPDEIGDLSLILPRTAAGASDLRVELMAADGTVLASATTRVEIAADEKSALVLRSDESGRIGGLIAHGEKMISVGYLAGARAYFKRAAEAGSGEAALKLGATYDPEFISEIGALGVKADPKEARSWYERAKELGVEGAEAKLKALKETWTARDHGGQAAEAESGKAVVAEAQPERNADHAAPTPASTSAPLPAGNAEWVSLSSYANVRTAPSSTADTIRVAEKGAKFRATGRSGNWIQITDPATSEVGWVYSRFLETAETPAR